MSKTRICTSCGEEKPLGTDFFRMASGKDGYYARCKPCVMISRRKPRLCTGCGKSYFHVGSIGAKGTVCPECLEVGRMCLRCNQFKPYDRFYQRKAGQKGGHRFCLDGCALSYNRELRYSVTSDELQELERQANGTCEICGRSGRRMAVDHNHSTGAVRGLICGSCNSGLGLFSANAEFLLGAIEYLARHNQESAA